MPVDISILVVRRLVNVDGFEAGFQVLLQLCHHTLYFFLSVVWIFLQNVSDGLAQEEIRVLRFRNWMHTFPLNWNDFWCGYLKFT